MHIYNLKTSSRFENRPCQSKNAGSKTRLGKCRTARMACFFLPALFLILALWPAGPAAAVEFVTREAFSVEKSRYKNYPFRVLFQKLHESSGAEKRKIRNVIILKQVFDPAIRQRAIAAGSRFESFYGVVKAVNGERLRLWLPESDSFKDFPVGIDRIPVENKHDYPATANNISDFAAIIHTLDNRIYQITISFPLSPPEALKVRRRGANNMVSWQPPNNVQAPSGYRVFVNDRHYKNVTGTSVEVPRSKEQADEFYVKAIYTHHHGRIASAATATLYDAASAREIEKRQQAGGVYQQFTAALGREDPAAARRLLDDNLALLTGFLSPERRAHILTAGTFFKALDEGDRLMALQPETHDNLARAAEAFQQAAEAAQQMPAGFKLSPVARGRIDRNAALRTALAARLQTEKAARTLDRISADLKPGQWEKARKQLYQQQTFLIEHLSPKERDGVLDLAAFFQSIEKGDLSAGIQPSAAEHLAAAMGYYQQAKKQSRTLPDNLDAGFIARQRIEATANRQASLAAEEKARLANRIWNEVVVDLNPAGWQNARTSLFANRLLLTSHLPAEDKAVMATLIDFFSSVDEGDRQAAGQPVTRDALDTAAMYYQRAAQKAASLPDNMDVGFITRLKTSEIKKLRAQLENKLKKKAGDQVYDQIVTALDTGRWREARDLLYTRQALLTQTLDARRKADCLTLTGFFRDIDAGDRLAGIQPPARQNLDAALETYRQAVAKTQSLPDNLDVGLIVRQKIRTVVARKDQLDIDAQAARAREVYDRIIANLTPAQWQTARAILAAENTLLTSQLDPARAANVTRLATFFQMIADGDRLVAQQPVTRDNLNMALSSYRLADQKAGELKGVADLSFLTSQRVQANKQQRAALEMETQQAGARKLYQEILANLDPTNWETGMRMILDRLPPVVAHLDRRSGKSARLLISIFQDIEAGDRLSFKRPETDSNLARARTHYQQAGINAEALEGEPDIVFIPRARLANVDAQRAALIKRQQALMAARQAPAPAPAAPPPPPPRSATAGASGMVFDDSVDAKTALRRGMKAFSKQDYDLSLRYFRKVYAKKIEKIKKAGKKQSFAVLGLHPKTRAEIIYLVQLELLKEKSRGDEDAIRDGLMELEADVESGSGPWAIIKERKRNRIVKHIERYPF